MHTVTDVYFLCASVMPVHPNEEFKNQTGEFQVGGNGSIDQFKEPAELVTSMSIIPSDADPMSAEAVHHKDQLDYLAEYLLNDIDSNIPITTDEISVMEKVNSLCSLIQKGNLEGSNSLTENHCDTFMNPTTVDINQNKENLEGVVFNGKSSVFESICGLGWEEPAENPSMEPETTEMIKKDPYSDLFLNLPHMTSPPKFINFSDDNVSHFG